MNKPIIKFVLKLVLSVVLIYLIFYRVDIKQFYNSFQSAKTGYFIPVILLVTLFLLPKVYKWYYLVKKIDNNITFGDAALSYLAGLAIGIITPARTGEIARVMYINLSDRLRGIGLVIIDRLFDIWIVILFSIFGSFLFFHYSFSIVLILISVCFILIFYLSNPMVIILNKIIRFLPFKKKFKSVVDALSICNKYTNTVVLLSTLVSYLVYCLQGYLFLLCFQKINFISVLESFPLIALVNVLPITLGGIGLRENAAIIVLGKFSITPEVAASVSFLLFVIDIVIPGVIGLLVWTLLKRSSYQLR